MEYTIKIKQNKDGWLSGQCEQLPQAISQGKDLDDLTENMKDSIETVLAYQQEERKRSRKSNYVVQYLTIRHETKPTTKAPKREHVYA